MAILNILTSQTGLVGVLPSLAYIDTSDTEATVLTAGYLNHAVEQGFQFSIPCLAAISTRTAPNAVPSVGWYEIIHSGGNWSVVAPVAPGSVILPTKTDHIATFTDTVGTLSEDPGTAISAGNIQAGVSGTSGYFSSFPTTPNTGHLRLTGQSSAGDFITQILNASMAAPRNITIPDGGTLNSNFIISNSAGTQTIATGSLALTLGNLSALAGNVSAGSDAHAGTLISFPSTTANGSLIISALNAGGAFNTTVRNSIMGQSSVVSIPDPGAATANFLLDTGAANIIAEQQFVGIQSVLSFGTGTWTTTRIAQGNYVKRHTAADETSIIGIDITPIIRAAASKGFRLDSFDYMYSIGTANMDAHTLTLDRIAYANNVAVSVTSIAGTYTLATATQANPYLTNCTITTPAFDVTADSKYVIEVTANNAATTTFDFYGIMLRFSQTIG